MLRTLGNVLRLRFGSKNEQTIVYTITSLEITSLSSIHFKVLLISQGRTSGHQSHWELSTAGIFSTKLAVAICLSLRSCAVCRASQPL